MTRSTSSSPLSRRKALGAALLASAALGTGLLSGCGAGQITQTNTQVAVVPGVSVDTPDGMLSLRDGLVAYADKYENGAVVPLQLRLFNRGAQAARLTGATSGQGQVVLVGSATPSPTATTPSATATASPSASGPHSPSNGASASPSATASPTPASSGSTTINIEIPAREYALLTADNGRYLAIAGLRNELRAGESIEDLTLTFTYADGTSATLGPIEVPMAVPLTPLPRPTGAGTGEH